MQPELPALSFDLNLPQIGNEVCVSLDISDDSKMLVTRITLKPALMRGLGQAILLAADKAEKTLVTPAGGLVTPGPTIPKSDA